MSTLREKAGGRQDFAWGTLRRVLTWVFRHWRRLIVVVIFSMTTALFNAAMVPLLGPSFELLFDPEGQASATLEKTVDRVDPDRSGVGAWYEEHLAPMIADEPFTVLVWLMVTLVVLVVLKGVSRFLQEYHTSWISNRVQHEIASETYDRTVGLPVGFFSAAGVDKTMAHFSTDMDFIRSGVKTLFGKLLREPLKFAAFLVLCLWLDWQLTLWTLLIFPPVVGVFYVAARKIKKAARRMLTTRGSQLGILQESLQGIEVVKAYGMEDRERDRFREESDAFFRHGQRVATVEAVLSPMMELLAVIGTVIAVLLGGWYVLYSGRLTSGEFLTFFAALAAMTDPLRKMGSAGGRIMNLVAAAERVFTLMDAPTEEEDPEPAPLPRLSDELRFENVTFAYGGGREAAVRDVDLEVPAGTVTALVGESGAGKSTLVKLLPRFHDPQEGRITVDGTDIRRARLAELRAQIGMVTQDTVLFNDTVAANIAYGSPGADRERIVAAARAANADGFVTALPDGYDTHLGERGHTLSGGQRQRLAIARAILRDPALLILDEATSHLDSESEALIQQALERFMQGRTSLVIAHRLSTIQEADRIVVMDDGRIVATGRHAELLETSATYRRLHERQFGTIADDERPEGAGGDAPAQAS